MHFFINKAIDFIVTFLTCLIKIYRTIFLYLKYYRPWFLVEKATADIHYFSYVTQSADERFESSKLHLITIFDHAVKTKKNITLW